MLRFELRLFARGDLFGRRDDDDVAVTPHVEAFRRHDDIEGLIPRNVLQPQRDAALHRVADDDVEAAEVGDQLQHGARLEILEVQGQALAGVVAILVEYSRSYGRLFGRRLELESKLIVGLVRDLVVRGSSRHDQARVLVGAQRIDREDGRREVRDIQPAHELLRQRRVLEVDDDTAAFLADVDSRARIVELDDDLACAIGAAAEVDVADGALAGCRCDGARGRGVCVGCAENDGPALCPGPCPMRTNTLLPSTRVS